MLKNQHTYHSLFKSVGVVSLCSLLITPRYLIAAEFEAVEGQYIVKRSPYCASISSPSAANVLDVFPSIGAELWQMEAYTVNSLSTDSCIEYVEPNYIIRLDNTPNDPDFNQLWGLDKISATTAWDIRTESSIIIAVIDTGIDYTHPDLAANMWVNQGEIPNNGIDDDGNGYIDDIYGYDFANGDGEPLDDHFHGTHCAGTIAAIGNNGTGVVGVNWSAKIMALKFFKLDSFGRPSGKISDAISAIEYATSMGAKITSNSWGGGPESQALSDAIQFAQQKGALFIAAAGNKSVNTDRYSHYPSGYDLSNIISVAATDQYDALSEFSNYGATSVDLGAPGTDIYSTVPNGSYGTLSGTSMATPHVAGLAGLLWSHNPSWTYRKVRDKILSSVEPLSSLAGKTVSGGRLNAYKALADGTTPPPQPPGDGKVEAHIEPTTITGSAPFTVYLDGRTSVGQIIQYKWEASIEEMYDCPGPDFVGIDEPPQSEDTQVTYLFQRPGVYGIHLTVTGTNGTTDSDKAEVIVNCPHTGGEKCHDGEDAITCNVPFNRAGFYVADVILANDGKEGAWGLSVSPSSGMNEGGFNGGAILKENGGMPGFITFQLTKREAVSLTPYEYTGKVSLLTVKVEKQDVNTHERTLIYSKEMSSGTRFTTQPLEPGYYVVTVYSQSDSPRGVSGISINASSMLGSVNLGGWLDTTGVGFGAFYIANPQEVKLALLSGKNYSDIGARGQIVLNVYYQDDDGNRQLYWTNYEQ